MCCFFLFLYYSIFMDLQEFFRTCKDPATLELAKFITDVKQHRENPYFEEMLALLGMAVEDPAFFEKQPLTNIPKNSKIVSPPNASELGYSIMTDKLLMLQRLTFPDTILEACELISREIEFSQNITPSFRITVGYLIFDIFMKFQEKHREKFFTFNNAELYQAWNELLKEENSKLIKKAEKMIDNNFNWVFIDEKKK